MDEIYLEKKIEKLLEERRCKNLTPLAIDSNDLYNVILDDAKTTLNNLFKTGKISTYKSINSLMIKLNE